MCSSEELFLWIVAGNLPRELRWRLAGFLSFKRTLIKAQYWVLQKMVFFCFFLKQLRKKSDREIYKKERSIFDSRVERKKGGGGSERAWERERGGGGGGRGEAKLYLLDIFLFICWTSFCFTRESSSCPARESQATDQRSKKEWIIVFEILKSADNAFRNPPSEGWMLSSRESEHAQVRCFQVLYWRQRIRKEHELVGW